MSSGLKVSKLNFELNPRGNLWFNDDSTFGHKLLSKMGWSRGKGLGKNEDGIKENIKIAKKETNTGVGWKGDDVPIAIGCIEYENILQNLQKQFNNPSDREKKFEKSLEQRSRSARNHLHYQKFVRVKDLNRYSEKDMKSIFLEKPQKPESDHPSRPPEGTPTFNSRMSVNDYFALKMQKKREEAAKLDVESKNINSSQPQNNAKKASSKKRKFVSESPEPETESNISSESANKKTPKKLKFSPECHEANSEDEMDNTAFIQSHLDCEKTPVKQKLSFENDNTDNNTSLQSHSESGKKLSRKQKMLSERTSKKEKKKRKKSNCEANNNSLPIDECSGMLDTDSSENIKNKKNKNCKTNNNSLPNDEFSVTLGTDSNETIKSKKNKNCKANINSLPNDECSLMLDTDSNETFKSKRNKKKKSKKNRLEQLKSCLKGRRGYDLKDARNVSFNEQVSYKILDTSLELCEEMNDLADDVTTVDESSTVNRLQLDSESLNRDCGISNEEDSSTNADNSLINTVDVLTGEKVSSTEEGNGLISEEEQETPPCFDLPKSGSGSNFNFWLDSQRQASKMKLYKEMAKKIRKDKALRSSNLLDIKGYGNWS